MTAKIDTIISQDDGEVFQKEIINQQLSQPLEVDAQEYVLSEKHQTLNQLTKDHSDTASQDKHAPLSKNSGISAGRREDILTPKMEPEQMEIPKIDTVHSLDVKENEPLVLPKIDEFVPPPAILSNKSKIPSDRPHPNWPYEEEDQKKRLGLLPMPVRTGSSNSVLSGKSNRAKLKSTNRSNIRM